MTLHTTDIGRTLHALGDNFESTFAQGNADAIADFYSENGMLLPAGSDFVKGKQAIAAYWQEAIDLGIKTIKLDIVEVEQHDNTLIEMSYYTMRNADNQLIDRGKGIAIWKHENDTWKMHRDIWTSNITRQ